nr:tetratricopeptide repeat protein [Candidatus Neomarinimicrobiota bacterium]
NEEYDDAIVGFADLVSSDATNELADNSQYWLAECYYSKKNFKRAIGEFEKVFNFAGTDKDDDAQLKLGLAYQSMGNIEKAREEFQRLIDYFPGSEYYPKAKEALKKLFID